jgi:hypothetical protein
MKTTKTWTQFNRSVREGTLPVDNYSGYSVGQYVITPGDLAGKVYDVRFINTPSSALYYVYVDCGDGQIRSFYPEELKEAK